MAVQGNIPVVPAILGLPPLPNSNASNAEIIAYLNNLANALQEVNNRIATEMSIRGGANVTSFQPPAQVAGRLYLLTDATPLLASFDDGGTWHYWTLQLIAQGQVTVSGASTTGTASFSTAFSDTSYNLSLTPVSSSGSPATASNRPLSASKSAGGFTLTTEAAPGGGNSVTFDYIAIHASA